MRNAKNNRQLNNFSSAIKGFLKYFKLEIIYGLLAVLFGVILGVIIISTNSQEVEIENIFDKNLLMVITQSRGFFTVFIVYLIYFLITVAIIYFFCKKRWCIIFPIIILTICGFSASYHISIMILLFGVFGFFNAFIIILPFNLIMLTCLIFISAIAIKKCLTTHKFGCNYLNQNCNVDHMSMLKFLIITGIIALFLKSVLMPIIRITIIIN